MHKFGLRVGGLHAMAEGRFPRLYLGNNSLNAAAAAAATTAAAAASADLSLLNYQPFVHLPFLKSFRGTFLHAKSPKSIS